MSRPRLALLDASHGDEHTPRNFRRELDADLAQFDVTAGALPPSPAGADLDGAVVTGSRASVYWDEEWIDPAGSWIAEAHDAGLPVLGVCFGHQLVADALGGEVAAMDDYEIGYREIHRTAGEDDPLLAGLEETFTAFTTHSDAVVELPPGATALAENDRSIHGFRLGSTYGVQFHPEYDRETAAEVTRGKDDQLDAERIQAVLADITPETHAAACEAKRLFDNFLAVVETTRGARAAAD